MTQGATEASAGEQQQAPQDQQQAPSNRLEDLLSGLPDEQRAVVLEQVSKARNDAATYRTRLRELEPKASEYDKLLESQKTEQQRATDAQQAAERRAQDAEREASRLRVALAKGLPPELATRLVGNTDDELTSDADRLLALVRPATEQAPSFDGGPRTPAPTGANMNTMIRRAAGRT